MLDDLRYIHDHDTADALGSAEKQWQQLAYEFEVFQDQVEADNIVYAGMGSSALAAHLSESWLDYDVPFQIVRDYAVPAYVNEKTYFIAASYSGNTEEVLSALTEAEAKNAQIAIITNGGQLADIARAKNYPLALLPAGKQPRNAVLYNLKALVDLLEQAGLISSSAGEQFSATSEFLKTAVNAWLPTVPTTQNKAKQVALEVIGKSAVVYAGLKLWPAAYKWKVGFNENAKHIAWCGQYPEFDHNEVVGWTQQPISKPYIVIELRSNLENPRIQKRFELSDRLLSGLRPAPIVVDIAGHTLLEQLLWAVMLGDFVTLYTALANGVDPTPIEIVEKLKKAMED